MNFYFITHSHSGCFLGEFFFKSWYFTTLVYWFFKKKNGVWGVWPRKPPFDTPLIFCSQNWKQLISINHITHHLKFQYHSAFSSGSSSLLLLHKIDFACHLIKLQLILSLQYHTRFIFRRNDNKIMINVSHNWGR